MRARSVSRRAAAAISSPTTTKSMFRRKEQLEICNTRNSDNTIIKIPIQSSQSFLSNTTTTTFSIDFPDIGKCVGIRFLPCSKETETQEPNWNELESYLHPEELQYGLDPNKTSQKSRTTFFLGRLAMRMALSLACEDDDECVVATPYDTLPLPPIVSRSDGAILKDSHGRPKVPHGFLGSISHKKNIGVALVTNSAVENEDSNSVLSAAPPSRGIGVDIEQRFSNSRGIAKRILTPCELGTLGKLDGVSAEEEVLLRFSLKEAVYKAMHPLINQFVGFQEAEITPHNNGTATVYLNLTSGAHTELLDENSITAHWRKVVLVDTVNNVEQERADNSMDTNDDCDDGLEPFFVTGSIVSLKKV
eukprot:CAMPEP_0171303282 /NCGR_PEP_ID=MMETSP0816-20121228/12811_1 /TAXON_ID=420281 /ORGANISM="Proboscia inermis, Strain CCAP1064/1" /LENGTH=361 /DNA_ID=CAMNT_0011782433 /DNA_START=33 /DNA_END=1118 /DNA_ORIENTATION=-